MTEDTTSPRWGNTTKLIVAFSLIALLSLLIWQFKYIIGPVLFAFLLSFLLRPIARWMTKRLHFSWRAAATVIYVLLFLILIGLITWGGFSLVKPLQNFTEFLQNVVGDMPGFINDLSSKTIVLGNFTFDFSRLNLSNILTELQGTITQLLGKIGVLLGNIASGAASTVTWTFFTILISYFISAESNTVSTGFMGLRIPRYQSDIEKMGKHLARIWNSFLRGQLTVFLITVAFYSLMLALLGVRYFFALALLAGLARFVPYVGPVVAWTTYFIVGLVQGTTIFGLQPLPYALIIVGLAWVTDIIMDNFVSPRIMSESIGVHPAVVLLAVIIAAKLLGFIGMLLAAPVVATLKLLITYAMKKLFDMDPWEDIAEPVPVEPLSKVFSRWFKKIGTILKKIGHSFVKMFNSLKNKKSNLKKGE